MRNTVGFSQRLKRAWLDDLLDRLVQTRDERDLRAFVDQRLRDELPGKEARAKAAGILLRIWSGVDAKHIELRDRAVAFLSGISGQERIWLHWGMSALAYPFFRDLAEVIGRMLTLQDDFTTAQVQARMKTTWGDRTTSKEAAQKLITSMVDWEVLRATKTKGHFLPARKMTTSVTDLQLWLLEAMLAASASDEIDAHQLLRLPELFPFAFTVGVGDLRKHEEFNIHRQGLDMEMVSVRQVKVEPPKTPVKAKKPKKKESVEPDQPTFFDEPNPGVVLGGNQPTTLPNISITTPQVAEKQNDVHMGVEDRSIFTLAAEEEKNLSHSIRLLGDSYDLVTSLERLYDMLPRLCCFPKDAETNDATYAAVLTRELMRVCRRQLTLGTLTLLRLHRGDANLHLRKAIEICAYTAKMGKHPHMARLWMEARKDEKAFEKFREKFKKLFPQDDAEFAKLGHHYDECSRVMHSSIYGGGGIDVFDTTQDATVIAFFFHITDAYLTMLRVFGHLLAAYAGEQIGSWTKELTMVEQTFRMKRHQWTPFIEQTTPTGT
jgi:hypothetical protein